MKLKNRKTLWGVSTAVLKAYGIKHRIFTSILTIADIILVFVGTFLLFTSNMDFYSYIYFLCASSLVYYVALHLFLSLEKWEAFKFYKRNAHYTVEECVYDLDKETLVSISYCIGIKNSETLSIYDLKSKLLELCCKNKNNAKKLCKLLRNYKSTDGNTRCFTLSRKNREFFIDFYDILNEEEDINNDN